MLYNWMSTKDSYQNCEVWRSIRKLPNINNIENKMHSEQILFEMDNVSRMCFSFFINGTNEALFRL